MKLFTLGTVISLVFWTVVFGGATTVQRNPKESQAGLAFASYYGDHMVLQQAPKRANVWGYADMADVGEKLELDLIFNHKNLVIPYSTKVVRGPFPDRAVWMVTLGPFSPQGKVTVAVTLGQQRINISDVIFGDVWVCSGQSNMAFTTKMMLNATQELEHLSDYPDVRVFTVATQSSPEPLYELPKVAEPWSIPTKESIGMYDWTYFSAVCWLFGRHLNQKLGYPIGMVDSNVGGTPVEAWSSPDSLKSCGIKDQRQRVRQNATANSVLYNAMIHPLLNMTIHGAIWYQGEANAGAPDTYNCTFPAMITDWRSKFNAGSNGQTDNMFPFGFVQLAANSRPDPAHPVTTGFPDIRWHQTADVGVVPNDKMQRVFMAVAMDLPDYDSPYGSVHPRDKSTVAERLIQSGLAVAYNWKIKFQSPQISAYYIDTGFFTLGLEFDNRTTPLDMRDKNGFEVCCSHDNQTYCPSPGTQWMSVPISTVAEGRVTLDFKACANMYIVGVRYAWRESPCDYQKCAIYTKKEGIPLAPFVDIGLIGSSSKDSSVHMYQYGKLYSMRRNHKRPENHNKNLFWKPFHSP